MRKYFLKNCVLNIMSLQSIFTCVWVLLSVSVLKAQILTTDELSETDSLDQIYQMEVINGDTLPLVLLQPVAVVASKKRDYVAEYKYRRLKKYVMKVYPYAKEAGRIIDEINEITADITKKRKQKKYLKQLEKDLKKTFEGELRKLTISQGKILTKLVNRETGLTTHKLIKEYKSGVTAFFWQTIGKRYGYDLKKPYDPVNDPYDKDIESIVLSLEEMGI